MQANERHHAAIHMTQGDFWGAYRAKVKYRRRHWWGEITCLDHHQKQNTEPDWIKAQRTNNRQGDGDKDEDHGFK